MVTYKVEVFAVFINVEEDDYDHKLSVVQVQQIPISYFESATYLFNLLKIDIYDHSTVLTLQPNIDEFKDFNYDPNNIGESVNLLIDNFKDGKYDTWMEGCTRFEDISPYEITLELGRLCVDV